MSHQAESASEAFAAVAILPKRAVEQAMIIEGLKEERSKRHSLIVWLATFMRAVTSQRKLKTPKSLKLEKRFLLQLSVEPRVALACLNVSSCF